MNEAQGHGSDVFVFSEIIKPKEGRAQDVLALSLKSAELLKGKASMIQWMVMKPEKKGGEICVISVWSSKSDFQNFLKSDDVAELLKSDDMKNIKDWMLDYNMLMSNLESGWHG